MRYAITVANVVVAVSVLVAAPFTTKKTHVSECQQEAMRTFGVLRKPDDKGAYWPPADMEQRYLLVCMNARGYVLEGGPEKEAGSSERSLQYNNPQSWSWGYRRLLLSLSRI